MKDIKAPGENDEKLVWKPLVLFFAKYNA